MTHIGERRATVGLCGLIADGIVALAQRGDALGDALVPLRSWVDLGNGWRLKPERYVIYSGFQYRYDPGVVLVNTARGGLLQ